MVTAKFKLSLYITEGSRNSDKAIANLEKYCREDLGGIYETEIIDLGRCPEVAQKDQIIAVPTLIRRSPLPTRILIGDLSDKDKVLTNLKTDAGSS